jgi:hypothetical protein
MRSIFYACALLTVGAACVHEVQQEYPGQPYPLSAAQVAAVHEGVAQLTVAPSLVLTRQVSAMINDDRVITVCGFASIDDKSDGGWAFIGILGGGSFTPAGLASNQVGQWSIITQCEKRGISLGADSAKPSDDQGKTLIARARDLDNRCRGAEGASASSKVCEDRKAAFKALNAIGWCYGKVGQVGYQNEWHRCEADSIRED